MTKNRISEFYPEAWEKYLREQQLAALANMVVPPYMPAEFRLPPEPEPSLLPDPVIIRAVVDDMITRSKRSEARRLKRKNG